MRIISPVDFCDFFSQIILVFSKISCAFFGTYVILKIHSIQLTRIFDPNLEYQVVHLQMDVLRDN
jgi:hypothetical protein